MPSNRRMPYAALPHQSWIDALKYVIAAKIAIAGSANAGVDRGP